MLAPHRERVVVPERVGEDVVGDEDRQLVRLDVHELQDGVDGRVHRSEADVPDEREVRIAGRDEVTDVRLDQHVDRVQHPGP